MTEPLQPPPPPIEPPAAPPPPGGGGEAPPGNPWEQRDRLGFLNALVENLKLFVTNPTEAFAVTRRQGDYLSPLIFAILIGWVMFLISQLWGLLFGASMMPMMPEEMRDQMGGAFAFSGMRMVISIVLYPIWATIALFIWSGIVHLCLMLVGGVESSEAGFEGSFRAIAYSSVANLAQIVPFVGGLIALVWCIFLSVVGLSTLHRTTQGKALVAILIPVALCCLCVIAAVFFGAAALLGIANN